MTKKIPRPALETELGVVRAALENDGAAVHEGFTALGFFDRDDPRFGPERLLMHLRAFNGWYAHDADFTITPEFGEAEFVFFGARRLRARAARAA